MNEIEILFQSTAFVVGAIIQLILIIVFIKMAINVSKIRKELVKPDSEHQYIKAGKLEFMGKNKEAIETYLEYIYETKQISDLAFGDQNAKVNKAAICIEALGGKVPSN